MHGVAKPCGYGIAQAAANHALHRSKAAGRIRGARVDASHQQASIHESTAGSQGLPILRNVGIDIQLRALNPSQTVPTDGHVLDILF